MGKQTATATCTAYRAVEEKTGLVVSEEVLVARVGWLTTITQALTTTILTERWKEQALDELAAGVGPDGRELPAKGYKALRRLGWGAITPGGLYVSDRVKCCAEEEAARALRSALHRRGIVEAILASWPADPPHRTDPGWTALRALLPPGVQTALIRNRTRQLRKILDAQGALPGGIVEAEQVPTAAAQTTLAAADKQLVTITRTGPSTGDLRVQLPLRQAPGSNRDWAWHVIAVRVPPHVPEEVLKICLPTVRIVNGRVRVDLPFETEIPFAPATGHRVAVAFDWGVTTLLTGVVGRLVGGRVETDGRALTYDATVISAKLHRLRGHREHLAAKRTHYIDLLAGLGATDRRRVDLVALHERAEGEHGRVCARIRHLNKALAWNAARWAVDQAIAARATVIYLEDLATLEARGTGKGNARLSGQVRGTVVEAIRHLAAKEKIAVVAVPARGTSKYCPRCREGSSVLVHAPAPDRLTERGWKWAYCPHCRLSCDRDLAAAMRIVSRGLLGQQSTITDRRTGKRAIRTRVEGNVTRVRRPKRPTRAARRARRTGTDLHPGPKPGRAGPKPVPPPNDRPASPRKLPARCPTGVWCPPPPWWGTVRRAKHPRRSSARRSVQILYGVSTTGPASTR